MMVSQPVLNTHFENAQLVIARHAHSIKNLEKMHGGGTQDLTEEGLAQAAKLATLLTRRVKAARVRIFHQKEQRSQLTANIIAEGCGLKPILAEGVSGVGLGIIAELNEDELNVQYPEVSRALASWRSGKIPLSEYPSVPGHDNMNDFAKRIGAGVERLLENDTVSIIIGTTSTINMMNHLMLHAGVFDEDHYDFIEYPFCGFTIWKLRIEAPPVCIYENLP